MIEKDIQAAVFLGEVYDVRTKRDGGGRVAIDFGADALAAIQHIQKIASARGCSFYFTAVPHGMVKPKGNTHLVPDENGEIPL